MVRACVSDVCGVEHVELRAGAGLGARARLAQGFVGLGLHFLLRVQNLARLDEIGIRRAHLQVQSGATCRPGRSWIFRKAPWLG